MEGKLKILTQLQTELDEIKRTIDQISDLKNSLELKMSYLQGVVNGLLSMNQTTYDPDRGEFVHSNRFE